MIQRETPTVLDRSLSEKTDTIYVWSDQKHIVEAIGGLRKQFTESIDSLGGSVTQLKNDERILGWVSDDALFATLTSILVFSLGLSASYLNEKNQEKKKRKKIRSIVFLLCEELSKELKKQADVFSYIAEAIDIDNNNPIPVSAFSVKSHKQLNEIKYERLYDAFQNELKNNKLLETFNTFWADVAAIEESISPQKDFALTFVKLNNQYQTQFEITLSQIATILAKIATAIHGTEVSKETHDFFLRVDKVNEDMQGDANSPTKIKSSYIEPLLELFNNPKHYHIHRNGELPNLLRKAQIKFVNLDNHHTTSRKNALTLKSICLDMSDRFQEFTRVFQQKKDVNVNIKK